MSALTKAFGLSSLAAWAAPLAMARMPEAGTAITNQAEVSYTLATTGLREAVFSNEVVTEVRPVISFDVTSDQSYVRSPGEDTLFAFEVMNTGNTQADLALNFGELSGDFQFSSVTPFIDMNGNGRIDGEDLALRPDMPVSLGVGTNRRILVRVAAPETANVGESASGRLSAELLNGDVAQSAPSTLSAKSASGTVLIRERALSLVKSVSRGEAEPGEVLTYTINLRNNSTTAVTPSDAVTDETPVVDGVATPSLVISDVIPLGTQFEAIVDAIDFEVVYRTDDAAPGAWTRAQPAAEDVAELAFLSADSLGPGQSRDFMFSVRLLDVPGKTRVTNTASADLPGSDLFDELPSNTVVTDVSGGPGSITFHDDAGFGDPTPAVGLGDPAYLQLRAASCNLSRDIDTVEVTVRTTPQGDVETVIAVETGPNTGIFQSGAIATAMAPPVLPGDGILQGRRRSQARATADCLDGAEAVLDLSPAGAVFSSVTNEPIPGAQVELIGPDGVVLAETFTDAEGLFDVTPGQTGTHVLRITPPDNQTAPSVRRAFPGFGRRVDPTASYGAPFSVSVSGATLDVDVPVDPGVNGTLSVEKRADKPEVRTGDFVQYTVEISNRSTLAVQNAEIRDLLPQGFSYLSGSGRLDGQVLSDPGLEGQELVWPLALISPNARHELTYMVQVGAGAGEGTRTNSVYAAGTTVGLNTPVQSNTATADVRIDNDAGAFSRDAVLLGRVFLDCNGDGLQNGADEIGVPGVVMHTQAGLSVRTDALGKFSFAALEPKTHVLDVYEPSLPDGAAIADTRVMNAGRAGSRFVPLKAGEIRSESFAIDGCDIDLANAVRARIAGFEQAALGAGAPGGQMQFDAPKQRVSTRFSQSLGAPVPVGSTVNADQLQADLVPLLDVVPTRDLTLLAETATIETGFLDLEDGAHVPRGRAAVRVALPASLRAELRLNGRPVPSDRIGQRVSGPSHTLIEYVALELAEGENTLTLNGYDSFGNLRETRELSLTAPGAAAKVRLVAPERAIADRARPVPIWLELTDKDGRPVSAPVEVTLTARRGRFDVRDTGEARPGLQTLMETGRARLDYLPDGQAGVDRITIDSPYGQIETEIALMADIDAAPIAVGLAEGAVHLDGGDGLGTLLADDELSLFEDTETGVEAGIYLKGRVLKDWLLTLRYDSDRDVEDELFRDVEPDEFYPVYGDTSERGFDARSRGKLFARLEKGASYVMFGDVGFEASHSAFQLGRYQRTLEGARASLRTDTATVDLYLAETDTGQQVLEFPARGISGPYDLGLEDVLRNSETVEILTRDRDQPGRVLKVTRLRRFEDYTLDYFARTLIFNRPVQAVDEDFNPVTIRVTLETEDGAGEDYLVFGGEASFDLNTWLSTGLRSLTSEGPSGGVDDRSVQAAFVAADIGNSGRIEAEVATAEHGGERGEAWRVSAEMDTSSGVVGARLSQTDALFDAPGASVSPGRREAQIYASHRLSGTASLVSVEALLSEDLAGPAKRLGVVGRYETALGDRLRGRVGARYVDDVRNDGSEGSALTVIAGMSWSPAMVPGANLDVEVEQDLSGGDYSALRLGADYAATARLALYAQAEISDSRTGEFGITSRQGASSAVRLGANYRISANADAFTEYRADGRFLDSGVAQGLTANWAAGDATTLRARIEQVQPISGEFERNTAAGVGMTMEPADQAWLVDADLDYAVARNDRQTWYVSTAYGRRWDDVTLLIRNRFAAQTGGGQSRLRDRLRVGWAHRPVASDSFNTLTWYEYEVDDTEELRETRHTFSLGGQKRVGVDWRLRGRLGGQYYSWTSSQLDADSVTLLMQGGADVDIGERWNLAGNLAAIIDGRGEEMTLGVGLEANMHVADNALFGIGYQYAEYDRERLEGLYDTGVYLRLRFKFDQSLWSIFDSF